MTITTLDGLVNAIGNNADRFVIDKASLANFTAGIYGSLWRATGQPGQGAIPPTTANICLATTVGGISLTQQTAPTKSYLTNLDAVSSNAGTSIEIHDRLVNVAGISGALTSNQAVNIDISVLHAANTTANLDTRKGAADYSDVQWWVEWYANTGATAANLIATATFNDGTVANLAPLVLGTSRQSSMIFSLNNLIQAAQAGKYIRGISNVAFTANTLAAGNVGITCTRYKGSVYTPIANARFPQDWQQLGLNEFYANSCPAIIVLTTTTSTGTLRATGKVSHG